MLEPNCSWDKPNNGMLLSDAVCVGTGEDVNCLNRDGINWIELRILLVNYVGLTEG
jgi:hypothetical protein